MEFFVTHQTAEHYSGDCAVAFVFKDKAHQNKDLQQLLELNRFDAIVGATLMFSRVSGYKTKRLLIVGLGDSSPNEKNYIKVLHSLSSAFSEAKVKNVVIPDIQIDNRDESWVQSTTARVLKKASYQVEKVDAQEKNEKGNLEAISIYSANNDATEINKGLAIANGMALTRRLGDLPSNICTPSYLAETAKSLAKSYKLDCEVLEESDMEALGMNSLLSVSKGSSEPGKLISLSYKNVGEEQPVVLVGK